MDHEDIPVQESLIRGVIWALDSCDEEDLADAGGEEMIDMSESEVHFVADSLADDTEVPDSQLDMAEGDEEDKHDVVDDTLLELASTVPDVVDALQELASTEVSKFQSDKERTKFSKLLLLVFLPRLYGDHEQDVNDAAVDLFWIVEKYVGV
jgi:hypothetical protein